MQNVNTEMSVAVTLKQMFGLCRRDLPVSTTKMRLQNSLNTLLVTIHAPFGDLEHADCQSGGPWSVLETGGNDN